MYKILKNEEVSLGRFKIILDTIQHKNKVSPYSYVVIKPGVCIIPFIGDDELLVIKEYRHAIKSWEYGLPCGMIDQNELPEDTVKRELIEEVGYDIEQIISLGVTYPSFGSTTEKIHLFAVKCGKRTKCKRDNLEEITCQKIKIEEFENMIKSNLIKCSAVEVAWLRWKMKIIEVY